MKEDEKVENNMDARIIIDSLLKALGLTAPKFAEEIGINYQRIFDLQRGRTKKFNPGVVNKICDRFPQVNKNYLYTGEGDVLNEASTSYPQRQDGMGLNQANMAEFMAMSHKLLQLFEQLQKKDESLSAKAAKLFEKEAMLNERERLLNEKEHELNMSPAHIE